MVIILNFAIYNTFDYEKKKNIHLLIIRYVYAHTHVYDEEKVNGLEQNSKQMYSSINKKIIMKIHINIHTHPIISMGKYSYNIYIHIRFYLTLYSLLSNKKKTNFNNLFIIIIFILFFYLHIYYIIAKYIHIYIYILFLYINYIFKFIYI